MSYSGWVKYRRGIMEHVLDGRLNGLQHYALSQLILMADAATGGYNVNAPILCYWCGYAFNLDTAERILKGLHDKGYIWYHGLRGSKYPQPYWINKYLITVGKFALRMTNLSQLHDESTISQQDVFRCADYGADHDADHDADNYKNRELRPKTKASTVGNDARNDALKDALKDASNDAQNDAPNDVVATRTKQRSIEPAMTHGDASDAPVTHNDATDARVTQGSTLAELKSRLEHYRSNGGCSEQEFYALQRQVSQMEDRA